MHNRRNNVDEYIQKHCEGHPSVIPIEFREQHQKRNQDNDGRIANSHQHYCTILLIDPYLSLSKDKYKNFQLNNIIHVRLTPQRGGQGEATSRYRPW